LRCVNENRKKFSRNKRKRQPIGMLGRSSGNHDWLLGKRLRFLRFSFTQRTQRKRLRVNGNRALYNNVISCGLNFSRPTNHTWISNFTLKELKSM